MVLVCCCIFSECLNLVCLYAIYFIIRGMSKIPKHNLKVSMFDSLNGVNIKDNVSGYLLSPFSFSYTVASATGLRIERSWVQSPQESPCCVLEQDTRLPTVLVKPRKRWLRHDMNEKLLTGTLSLNTNKLSHYRVSTHVSTAYQDTKGTSRVRRTYVSIRSSYSSIRSSYSSYAEVLRFFKCALKCS